MRIKHKKKRKIKTIKYKIKNLPPTLPPGEYDLKIIDVKSKKSKTGKLILTVFTNF